MAILVQDPCSVRGAANRMRILILGWLIGKGSTGVYGAELAAHLARSGHSVTCLSAGTCDWRRKPHVAVKQSVPFELLELRNPPVMACTRPADPSDEIASPETERLLSEILVRIRPDVVLILDFPGWPAHTVKVCHAVGAKVAVFLQNFWPFCTRLSLLDRWGRICTDYAGGERCVACMENIIGTAAARWRARLPALVWRWGNLHTALKRSYHAFARARSTAAVSQGPAYAARRMAYAKAISEADLLCGISRRTLELAAQFGASSRDARVVPIVLTHVQAIRRARQARANFAVSVPSPIRFGYLGAHAPEKGTEFLVRAFRGIAKDVAVLHCFGGGTPAYLAHLAELSDPANPPIFHGGYKQADLPTLLREIDVGVVPSNCEDTRPNTILEFHAAGIPVIGSRIGGIPEQIEDGKNGVLFEPGDAVALRSVIDRIIRFPEIIDTWHRNVPSEFDSQTSWEYLERALRELKAHEHQMPVPIHGQ